MFGTFRLLLAIAVALSHIGITVAGLNPGVTAVAVFYLISGFMMTGLLRQHYTSIRVVHRFYLDRALRIYPQYLFVLVLTITLVSLASIDSVYLSGLEVRSYAEILLANLAIIPLNFFMFTGIHDVTLIPPAWSLGAELQFYLLLPFVLLLPARGRLLLMLASLLVFMVASTGLINSDWYGYRLLPGILWVFLLGGWLQERVVQSVSRADFYAAAIQLAVLLAPLLLWGLWLQMRGQLALPFNREVLLGVLAGAPAILLLAQLPRHRFDEKLGDLSYGTFLAHFLVVWLGKAEILPSAQSQPLLFIGISLFLGVIGFYLVERPVVRWRRRLRSTRTVFSVSKPSSRQAAE
ncbi:MAG: acyltransferase [Marinobacterium sp.]|nr:acyltransferase [Marinobacterium sp.]